ncbi:hypothetical protein [Aeromonas cavernicola]|uniref:hypothetical protein n=1 Tax=Aeromonas cavernicola TaxID=1006623 RepID=UPI0012FDF5DB|nr:hypothetical protein [Aeromonas cavernicola]
MPPTQINNINAIPPYAPRANDGGKNAELIVRAIAEPRSFPTNTALSTEVRSTAFAIPYLPTSLPTANWLNHAGSIGSHTINGQPLTVSRSGEVNVLTSALPIGLCGGYPNYYTGAGTRLAETSAGGRLTLNFSRPIKNIKLAIVLTDVNEVFSFTTNATSAPVLTAYGTYNVAGTQITAARCRPPTVSGNTVTASGTTANDGSYTYYLNIGGDYFTQLTIANNGQGLVPGGAILFYNYSQASLGN